MNERLFMMSRIIAVLVLIVFAGGCASFNRPGDDWFARDKAMHFGASAIIAGATTAVLIDNGRGKDESAATGFGVAVVFGIGKESYDAGIKRTYWSWKDFIWDVIGGAAGAMVASEM